MLRRYVKSESSLSNMPRTHFALRPSGNQNSMTRFGWLISASSAGTTRGVNCTVASPVGGRRGIPNGEGEHHRRFTRSGKQSLRPIQAKHLPESNAHDLLAEAFDDRIIKRLSLQDCQLLDVKAAGNGYAALAALRGKTTGALKAEACRLCARIRHQLLAADDCERRADSEAAE